MKTIALVLSSLLFTSCMHLGMHSMDEGHQSTQADPVIEKEVVAGNVKAVATFPPLFAGQKEVLTLRLSDATSQKPVSGADVRLHVQQVVQEASDEHHMMASHSESEADSTEVWNVREMNDEAGTYSLAYRPGKGGPRDLAFHVHAMNGKPLDSDLVIGKRVVIKEESMDHSGGMMGSSGTWNMLLIVGGIVMMGMMVFMIIH